MSQYTDHKVFHRLAAKLPECTPTFADFVRWSVQGGTAGVAGQRARHCGIYAHDSDIAAISQIPEEAWDPARPDLASHHGIIWLSLSDLHHNAVGSDPVIAVVAVGQTVFFNITLSTTIKHIRRDDGEDENGVTRLMLAVLNHYPTLTASRFAEDVTRAGRDEVDWAAITGKHRTRALSMIFGGQTYDTTKDGDRMALAALGMVSSNDDPMRRRKTTGSRLMKYLRGGAAISESQMPHGWGHKKDHHGRAVAEGERGLVPEADAAMAPVLQALYTAHAAGETYQQLAARMVAFEADGQLRRRDHTDLDNTYASILGDPQASYDAAKALFVKGSFRPRVIPSSGDVERYLEGEDPAEVFDADVRLYLGKVELVRSGRYFRRLANDIRGRNIVLNGIPAQYRDDRDEYGWFDVLSEPWAWPVTADGLELPRFGIDDETCRKVGARLLRELRAPKAPTGGRAHRTPTRRALQRFDNWEVAPGAPTARYEDEPTQWGVEARRNNSGKANFILLHRRASAGIGPRTGRGWSYFGPGESKPNHTAATGSLAELCASVAVHLDLTVRELLEADQIATLAEVAVEARPVVDKSARLRHKIEQATVQITEAEKEVRGHRTMAALAAAERDEVEAAGYAAQARETTEVVVKLQRDLEALQQQLDREAEAPAERDTAADIGVVPYLVVGLERSARDNGTGPARLGELCDEFLTCWRFHTAGDDLHWSCEAHLPLRDGGHARLPLTGVIANVRTRTGKKLATTQTVARYVFEEGRDLNDVAAVLQCNRKTLLTQRVMPYLVDQGVTARGAKCALVDHPIPDVRRAVHAALVDPTTSALLHAGYLEHLGRTYLDPDLQWGDSAVPDDTTWIQAALTLLTSDTITRKHGLAVVDVALAVGRSEDEVRRLVVPTRRSAGFTRPRYLAYADKSKTKVKAIGCPHGRCKGRRFADHAVLLPEVAASGYGVICRNCRRAPASSGNWEALQFPAAYLGRWSSAGPQGSLRDARRTVTVGG